MFVLNVKLNQLYFFVLFQRTLSKYFNPCYATARLKPTFISKVRHTHPFKLFPCKCLL